MSARALRLAGLALAAAFAVGTTAGSLRAADKPAPKPAPPKAQPAELVIQGGRILTMSGPPIEEGAILVREGKIVEVGERVHAGERARRIDARGKVVIPGMIDAYTRLGLVEISLVSSTVDDDEGSEPVTPQVRALDSFNPLGRAIAYTREHGITCVLVAPRAGTAAANVIAGQSAVLKLNGASADQMLLKSPAGVHVTLGEGPKSRFRDRSRAPVTRMGEAALLRAALSEGKEYTDAWKRYEEKRKTDPGAAKSPDRDLKKEAMADVVSRRMPLFVHCHRADDILTALRVAQEFGVRPILVHATEGYKVASEIARSGVSVIVGPVSTTPDRMETLEVNPENPAILARAGVRIAITTAESHLVSHLPYEAGLAAASGLPAEEALRAITLSPAQILGVADRVGSIEPGKDADLVILDGDPLEIITHVEWVFIGGELVYRRGA